MNERVLTPTGLGFSLWTRPALLDETVIEEVIVRDGYGISDVRLHGRTVVDCGAHIGVFSRYAVHLGAARVLAIEPEPENLALLEVNTCDEARIAIVPKALGQSDVEWTRMVGESGGAHANPLDEAGNLVEQTSIQAVFDEWVVDRVAILKLDMEGGEVNALLDCSHDLLARCDRIVMETHGPLICPWMTQPEVGWIVEHLLYTHNVHASGYPTRLGKITAFRNGVVGGW